MLLSLAGWLQTLGPEFGWLRVVQYLTFRAVFAAMTALLIGIVAGRLKERFGRPAIVIAETDDGTGKGSGRSISGVDLGAAVLAAKDSGLLIAGGGLLAAKDLFLKKR